jgi:hypothetical protein
LHFSRKCALRKRLDNKFFNEINDLETISDVIQQKNSFQMKDLEAVMNVLLEICIKNTGDLQRFIGGLIVLCGFRPGNMPPLSKKPFSRV